MPYFQCPRCGGTDSFGQWEQRFNNQNITYRDNQNRQVGSSNGGFGVSNVRQQYCSACMSVKMDMKFTQKEVKTVGIAILILVGMSALYGLGIQIFLAFENFTSSVKSPSITTTIGQLGPTYYGISGAIFLFGCSAIQVYRKIWIRNQDKKFLQDRFHKPRLAKSLRFMLFWFTLIFVVSNVIYLFLI